MNISKLRLPFLYFSTIYFIRLFHSLSSGKSVKLQITLSAAFILFLLTFTNYFFNCGNWFCAHFLFHFCSSAFAAMNYYLIILIFVNNNMSYILRVQYFLVWDSWIDLITIKLITTFNIIAAICCLLSFVLKYFG